VPTPHHDSWDQAPDDRSLAAAVPPPYASLPRAIDGAGDEPAPPHNPFVAAALRRFELTPGPSGDAPDFTCQTRTPVGNDVAASAGSRVRPSTPPSLALTRWENSTASSGSDSRDRSACASACAESQSTNFVEVADPAVRVERSPSTVPPDDCSGVATVPPPGCEITDPMSRSQAAKPLGASARPRGTPGQALASAARLSSEPSIGIRIFMASARSTPVGRAISTFRAAPGAASPSSGSAPARAYPSTRSVIRTVTIGQRVRSARDVRQGPKGPLWRHRWSWLVPCCVRRPCWVLRN
jgi:hypothetical protein